MKLALVLCSKVSGDDWAVPDGGAKETRKATATLNRTGGVPSALVLLEPRRIEKALRLHARIHTYPPNVERKIETKREPRKRLKRLKAIELSKVVLLTRNRRLP